MNGNKKSGKAKFQTLVNRYNGRRVHINRIKRYTGLSEKSIKMYTRWYGHGKLRKNVLNVSYGVTAL